MVVELFPHGCLPVSVGLFVLATQHVETVLAASVLVRETHPLPASSLAALAAAATPHSSFLLLEDIFTGNWDTRTLHLGNSSSPNGL